MATNNANTPVSIKTPLRYPGGKTRAIKVLDEHLPEKIDTVLAPFLGGGSYELHLTGKGSHVEGYDVFVPLANFWEHLLTNPSGLANSTDALRPLGKTKFKEYQTKLATDPDSSLADASKFLAVNRCSFSGATLSGGYSQASEDGRLTDSIIERVRGFQNSLLTVKNKSFETVLDDQHDFIFADPPYRLPATASNKLYGVSGSLHDDFNHDLFANMMKDISTPWLITYNDSPEIRKAFQAYNIFSVSWSYGMNATKKSSEIIIRNY